MTHQPSVPFVCVHNAKTYLDWTLDDPAGAGIEVVRAIHDDIRRRVEGLVEALDAGVAPA